MPRNLRYIPLLSVLFLGLVTGLLYSFFCAVMPGMHELNDAEFIGAMQSINLRIQNPWFLSIFIGLLILLPVSIILCYRTKRKRSTAFFLAAFLVYFMGVIGTTALGNIPLNNELAKLDLKAMNPDLIIAARHHFEGSWNQYHILRTFAAILSFILGLIALMQLSNNTDTSYEKTTSLQHQ